MITSKPNVSESILVDILERNNVLDYKINKDCIVIENADQYNRSQLDAITRNFNYFDIFLWSDKGIENIILWEKPERIKDVINEFNKAFPQEDYSLISSIEAKGFILGGIFTALLKKPFVPIRKHKKIYNNFAGHKASFRNWKKQQEALFLFENKFGGKKTVVIDDLLHTGNSLKASTKLLREANIELVGVFYLADYAEDEVRRQFKFPINSLLRLNSLLENCY